MRLAPLLVVLAVACDADPEGSAAGAPPVDSGAPDTAPAEPTASDTAGETGETDETDAVEVVYPALCAAAPDASGVPEDLQRWAEDADVRDNFFFTRTRLDALDARVAFVGLEGLDARLERGWLRLREGRVDEALDDLVAAEAQAVADGSARLPRIRHVLAMAWIRAAEVDNCVSGGTDASCIFPFSPAAIQRRTDAMEAAIVVLRRTLAEDAHEDPTVLAWMWNVAAMAIDRWPDAVDAPHRLPAAALDPEAALPAWTNVGSLVGLDEPGLAGGSALEDLDGDGRLDLLVSSMHPGQGMRVLLQGSDGSFCDATHASGLAGQVGVLSFTTADYDNDGDVDLFAPRGGWMGGPGFVRGSLLRNRGDGHFEDVTAAVGLDDVLGPSQVSEWFDVDDDGLLDLFVGREYGAPSANAGSLYVQQPDGTFVDEAASRGLSGLAFVKGADTADIDLDGDLDLYVSQLAAPNVLFRNDGGVLTRVTTGAPELPINGFTTFFLDADQDGDPDLFAAAYDFTVVGSSVLGDGFGRSARAYAHQQFTGEVDAPTARLYRNDGGAFVDVTEAVGLDDAHAVMSANTGDLDADGWPDLYLGTGAPSYDALEANAAYWNDGGVAFRDVTTAVELGHLQKGHGIAFGDIDGDGDEDLLAQLGGAYRGDAFADALFVNPTFDGARAVLRLVGRTVNRGAVGARVAVQTELRTVHATVGTGGSFGNNSLQVELGLGEATEIQSVTIVWPGGEVESVDGVQIGHRHEVEQGRGVIHAAPLGVPREASR